MTFSKQKQKKMAWGLNFLALLVLSILALQTTLVSSAPVFIREVSAGHPAYVREARNATNDPECPLLTWESCCDLQRNMTNAPVTVNSTDISDNTTLSNDTSSNSTAANATMMSYPSGRYTLGHYGPFSATYGYCDLETDGGGWLVIFRRESELDFKKTLKEYEDGFGELEVGNTFWYGLKSLNHITNRDVWELRVDLFQGAERVHAHYASISIGHAIEGYVLRLGSYIPEKSTASDTLHVFNGKMFYTHDNDSVDKCAWLSGGGWWYGSSDCTGINGGVLTSKRVNLHGWFDVKLGYAVPYDRTEMKIRQVNCLA